MTQRRVAEMVRDQNPLTLAPTTTVKEACRCMRDRRVGAVLVTEDHKRLVGIFTGRDAVARVLAEGRDPATTKLSEVMTRDPSVIAPGKTAVEALRLMHDGDYRHVPIVKNGQVIGVVSRGDFRGIETARLDEETGLWERI